MRIAFSFLGAGFIIVFALGYVLLERAHAPAVSPQGENSTPMSLNLTSSAFENNGVIPSAYTCDGENRHPPLSIAEVPEGAQSLVLIMEDRDIPQAVKDRMQISVFDHWVLYNIPAGTTEIVENSTPPGDVGMGTRSAEYAGPCPPKEYEPREHRYIFTLSASDTVLRFEKPPTKKEVHEALAGHVLAEAVLVGRYRRP